MQTYCLDTNVYIEGWNRYWSYDLCPEYWDILDKLAKEGTIFSPIEVRREIEKHDDGLWDWIKPRSYFFRDIDEPVQIELRSLMASHGRLVDSIKQRSVADPWVIAYAKKNGSIVVTKETPSGNDGRRIKIPDVCEALNIEWINDFELARRLGIRFKAAVE